MSTKQTDTAPVQRVRAIDVMQHLKIEGTRFRDYKARGVFVELPGGGFDLDACRHGYIAHLRDKAAGREAGSGDLLARERARQASASADKIEAENAHRRGELLEAPVVKRLLDEEFGKVRAACLNLPGAVANDLTHLSPAEKARVADIVGRSVDDLFAVLRDGAGVARDAGAMQIGEAAAGTTEH